MALVISEAEAARGIELASTIAGERSSGEAVVTAILTIEIVAVALLSGVSCAISTQRTEASACIKLASTVAGERS